MPSYHYVCDHCGYNQVEYFPTWEWRDMQEHELRCECCGEQRLIRKPAAPNFQVKGYNASNGYSKG